jgi:polyisoprenyl-teichoic acid--peptidoglycan teichoic acid transferase
MGSKSSGQSSGSKPRRHHQSKPALKAHRTSPNSSRIGATLRFLTWGLTFTLVTTLSAGIGATVALVTPLRFIPGLSNDGAVPIADLFRTGIHGLSRPVNILVMGVDANLEDKNEDGTLDPFKSRSDTMLLTRLDPDNKQVSILSIPRDTRVRIPDVGVTKINAANYEGGADLASTVVSETLNDVPVDRYVRVNTGAFRELVDTVGGVEVFVPRRMVYEDKTQGLSIDLEPGLQRLNGEQAEGFSRFRQDDLGDIGRAQRQQTLIKALQKQLANPLTLTKLPQILEVAQKNIDTDLSVGEMLALMQFSLQIKTEQLRMVLLPGRFSQPQEYELSYWIMDEADTEKIMQSYFGVLPEPDQYQAAETERTSVDNVRISIQNASGDPEGGSKMLAYLNQQGFYQVSIANEWPQILTATQVIPQWGDLEAAKAVQPLVSQSELAIDSTGDLRSELTIRVGKNWLSSEQAQLLEQSNSQ